MEAGGVTPTISLKSTGRSRRRRRTNQIAEGVSVLAAFLAIGVLALVVISVFVRGVKALNIDFFTQSQVDVRRDRRRHRERARRHGDHGRDRHRNRAARGNPRRGVCRRVRRSRVSRLIRLALDVLNGVPSIVVGIFATHCWWSGSGYAAWKGSVALAIVMLPVVARSTIEVLGLVPDALRDGSYALGVSKWRTVLSS